MKNLYFTQNSDFLTTQCPFCETSHTITKTDAKNFDGQKVVRFVCTCDCAFHQRICKKNPREIGLISALTSLDFKVIRYKLGHQLASFSSILNRPLWSKKNKKLIENVMKLKVFMGGILFLGGRYY